MAQQFPHEKAEQNERQVRKGGRGIWGGVVLILLGLVFLLQQFGFELRNWWAIFILFPAVSSFAAAYEIYRRQGYVSYAVRNTLIGGLFPFAVAIIFLLGLDWGIYWPVFIILGGLALISNGMAFGTPDEPSGNLTRRLYQPWSIWTGLGALLLGSGFLLKNTGSFNPDFLLHNWWGIAILFPAFGGLITTILLYRERDNVDWVVTSNLLAAVIVAVPGIVALTGVGWNLITPIILIAVGLVLLIGFRFRS